MIEAHRPIAKFTPEGEDDVFQSCGNCLFHLDEAESGPCRFDPPRAVAEGKAETPNTPVTWWCGRWEERQSDV